VEESLKDCEDAVVADLDAAEVLQPGVGAFDFPSLAVAAELSFIFKSAMAVVAAVRSDQFCAAPFQPRAQRVGVVAAIGYHAPQAGARSSTATARHSHLFERAFRKPVFGDLRGRKLRSDRYAAAVDHHHALRTFPTTCLADPEAPFFAVTKVASRNASSQSNSPRSSICASSFRQARSQTPCSSHIRNRRQHVEPSGYPSGRSRQRAPVRKTHKIPRKHARLEAHGRPRPSLRRFGSGNNGTNTAHCSSLNKASRFFIEQAHHPTRLTQSHSLEAAPIYATGSRK
jgi:hypothetical protein